MSKEKEHNVPKIENITGTLGAMNALGVPEAGGWIALSKVKRKKKGFRGFRFTPSASSLLASLYIWALLVFCMRDFEELHSKASHEIEILNS